jgi:hypothetical protein
MVTFKVETRVKREIDIISSVFRAINILFLIFLALMTSVDTFPGFTFVSLEDKP